MQPLAADWAFTRAAVAELKDYLLFSGLNWPIQANRADRDIGTLPPLTPGNLLLSMKRLQAFSIRVGKNAEQALLFEQIDAIRQEWRANWERKIQQEWASRLNLWTEFLQSVFSEGSITAGSAYAFHVRHRAILQIFADELSESQHHPELGELDRQLIGRSEPGDFIWEAELANGFSPEEYWFLYRKLNPGSRRI